MEVPLIDQNGLITTYELLYEPIVTFNDLMNIKPITINVTATELSTLLINLQEFVSYCITVRAYTSIGPGPYSDGVLEMTLEDHPGSPPPNITVDFISSALVAVVWEKVPLIDQNGIITQYEVICTALEAPGRDINLETLTLVQYTPNNDTYLSPLEALVTYSIAIRAFTAVGAGPYSNPKFITTPEEGEWEY